MEKWDAEHNLVIVYYTGHGSHIAETKTSKGYLSLHAYARTCSDDLLCTKRA